MNHLTKFKNFISNINEGKAYNATKKPYEKHPWDENKKESFREKIENHVKSLNCTIKRIGNDLEIYKEKKHIIQILFRDNFIGIKKVGDKFVDEMKYTELGKIKSKINNIVNK